jgi:hypothetical protein
VSDSQSPGSKQGNSSKGKPLTIEEDSISMVSYGSLRIIDQFNLDSISQTGGDNQQQTDLEQLDLGSVKAELIIRE